MCHFCPNAVSLLSIVQTHKFSRRSLLFSFCPPYLDSLRNECNVLNAASSLYRRVRLLCGFSPIMRAAMPLRHTNIWLMMLCISLFHGQGLGRAHTRRSNSSSVLFSISDLPPCTVCKNLMILFVRIIPHTPASYPSQLIEEPQTTPPHLS